MAKRITDMKKGGVEFGKSRRNIMGTLSFEFRLPNMRKMQEFIVYPVTSGDTSIMIQSGTRIGRIDMSNGVGVMSQSHPNGAYGVHLVMDKLVPFELSTEQLDTLKEQLAKTAGSLVGSSVVKSDNSGADKFAEGGTVHDFTDTITSKHFFSQKYGHEVVNTMTIVYSKQYEIALIKSKTVNATSGFVYDNSVIEVPLQNISTLYSMMDKLMHVLIYD